MSCLFVVSCLAISHTGYLLADNYEMNFHVDNRIVNEVFEEAVVDVTLQVTNVNTQQEKEIANFNADMSDIIFIDASYVEGSLRNAIDSAASTPILDGFLKRYEYRQNQRVSLTTAIKFQITPNVTFDDANAQRMLSLRCRGQRFRVYDPTSMSWMANKEKYFDLLVQKRTPPPMSILSPLSPPPPSLPPPSVPLARYACFNNTKCMIVNATTHNSSLFHECNASCPLHRVNGTIDGRSDQQDTILPLILTIIGVIALLCLATYTWFMCTMAEKPIISISFT